jgi:hypothetical protein
MIEGSIGGLSRVEAAACSSRRRARGFLIHPKNRFPARTGLEVVVIYLDDVELAEIPKRISGQQFFFLRKLREHPHNLPLKYWPRSTTWRRWLRQPGFVRAMQSIIDSCESQTQVLMAGAAQQAAVLIQATLTGGNIPLSGSGMNPAELKYYDQALKRLMGVLWLQMARSDSRQRQATMQQMKEQLTATAAEADDASGHVATLIEAPPGAG